MKLALVGLPLVGQRLDPFGSIPAMPTALPPLAAVAWRAGASVQTIDGFGLAPEHQFRPASGLVARGLEPEEIAARLDDDVELVGVTVHAVTGDTVALQTIAAIRRRRPEVLVAVGGAHPAILPDRFLEAGARWVVRGEGESALRALIDGTPPGGVIEGRSIENLDELPTPDFGALPLQTYWSLGLGHGPVAGLHLDITTSRGCSQGCQFCATPGLAKGSWRGMSAEAVVALFDELCHRWGVWEFHIEDDDFSADRDRVQAICEELLRRGRPYRFSLPSGVRAQSLDVETVHQLAAAGCRYVSLAPESGAERVRRAMGKDIDLDHLVHLAEVAAKAGLRVGCFLILGYPGERSVDRRQTAELAETLVRLGVDDLSVFIWSPLPGAAAFELERGWARFEQLCWTPRWRARYGLYEGARVGTYLRAMTAMVRARPWEAAASLGRVLTGRYETKGEMTAARMLRWRK